MGNRRHHKKLRTKARAVMATTGESYQRVLTRLRSEASPRRFPAQGAAVDLIAGTYFGVPVTLATFEILGDLSCVVLSSRHLERPFPGNPLLGLARPRSFN
jgi:hypothetical protein